jgi:hypothetical protein
MERNYTTGRHNVPTLPVNPQEKNAGGEKLPAEGS